MDLAGRSVAELLSQLEIETRGVAVAVDGEIIHRSSWSSTTVADTSNVEIVTATAGG